MQGELIPDIDGKDAYDEDKLKKWLFSLLIVACLCGCRRGIYKQD